MENKFEKYMRLSQPQSYNDSLEAYKTVLDSAMWLSKSTHDAIPTEQRTESLKDAMILFQMSMTKGIAIKALAESLNYYNEIGDFSIPELIDPMSIAALTRTQYEAYSTFHNIFNSNNNDDVEHFLYDSWVLAGLKERQRFPVEIDESELEFAPAYKIEIAKKVKFERDQIDSILDALYNNPIYINMSEGERKVLDNHLKKRVFQFEFKNNNFVKTDWLSMFLKTGVKELFKPLYSIMSLSTHPSNVSVFQYGQMFEDGSYKNNTMTLLKMSEKIMCFFIADFCAYISEAKQEYQKLPDLNKVIIETSNNYMRTGDFVLSNTLDKFSVEIDSYMREKLGDEKFFELMSKVPK